MNYYREKVTNLVYAYDDDQLITVARISELEALIQNKEQDCLELMDNRDKALSELEEVKVQLNQSIDSEDAEDVILALTIKVDEAARAYAQALEVYVSIDNELQSLKTEYATIPSIFFEVRENINAMKKMTAKEVDAHLNPPVSKERLIAEAEQKKKLLLNEASEAIAPLQDAVELDMAKEEEIALLQEWRKYRVLLNRVDTSKAPGVEWPQKPI